MAIHNAKRLKVIRKRLRSTPTPAEVKLWKALQNSKLGKKFRRQHSVGPYVLDFYCPECKLAIEIDGANHFQVLGEEYDSSRTQFLKTHNITVRRFENRDIIETPEFVLETVRQRMQK